MKQNLIKIFFIISVFLNANLVASPYRWSAEIDKTSAVVNEAIYLKYICEFEDGGELYTIDFNPVGDYDAYKILLLRENQIHRNGHRVNTYEYIAYAKESGEVEFAFDMSMKKTTQESITYTTKSRDDDRDSEDFSSTMLRQDILSVEVEDVDSDLVGNFTIHLKKDETSSESYKPYHMEVIIEGVGNFSSLVGLEYEIDDVKVFAQKPLLKTTLTKDGEVGSWSQKFAFVSKDSFSIQEKSIVYYDLAKQKVRALKVTKSDLDLKEVYKKEELLDITDDESSPFSFEFIYYIFTFVAGFMVAKIERKKREKITLKDKSFQKKIEKAKSLEELIMILAIKDSKKYENLIMKVEKKELISLKEVKKSVL